MNYPDIIWESRSPVVLESFKSHRLLQVANGGNAYDVQAAWQLEKQFRFQMSTETIKKPGEGMLAYWARIRKNQPKAGVIIREPFPIVFGRFAKGVKYVGMIHHIDEQLSRKSISHRWYFSRLKKRLLALDLIITVSEYWAEYLRGLGCENVKVIYNAFQPEEFNIPAADVNDFKKQNGIPFGKPVIYIGNASRQKGVYGVYAALKDAGYHLIMSGPQQQAADLPVQYFKLDRKDYLRMLHACDVVVCMSELVEGWNRIAHEAMMCKVPVIGNGRGGMMELLQGGKQSIISSTDELPARIEAVIANREIFAAEGYRFASQFDMNYFANTWNETMSALISSGK